ncbi:protein-L-isoaspartate(D-aspartate) O-methyltransferase [Deltaproteobacteria bacterium TL4]
MMDQKRQLHDFWRKHNVVQQEALLSAFLKIPREDYIPEKLRNEAYADHPLPIGQGQTISQPTTVMMMLELLKIESSQKVLEIGAGSGYNAALMSCLAAEVYSVETIPNLVEFAKENLSRTKIGKVTVIWGDGKQGYPPQAPYDRIIVTAAAEKVPNALCEQLKIGGYLVLPVGEPYRCEMTKIYKIDKERFKTTHHGLFSFVPLV